MLVFDVHTGTRLTVQYVVTNEALEPSIGQPLVTFVSPSRPTTARLSI